MSKCAFCNLSRNEILFETESSVIKEGNGLHHGHLQVIFKRHAEDILDLSVDEYGKFCDDLKRAAFAVKAALKPDKLNYALLGNWINHLHWHIYPRYKSDPDFAQPPVLEWKVGGMRVPPPSIRLKKKPLNPSEVKSLKKAFK